MKRILFTLAWLVMVAPAFGQCILKQATATQEISIGPFLDSADGDTEKTGLTIANTDVRLKKGSADWAAKNSGGATAEEKGNYRITLDATDTATVGILEINVHVSGALNVWKTCYVVEEVIYDGFYAASALGYIANAPVNVAQFGGSNGTFASGRPEVNTAYIAGSIVSASSAQLGVNVVNFGGSAGTFAGGRPDVNTVRIGGTVQTAGDIPARLPAALTTDGNMKTDTLRINGQLATAAAGITFPASIASPTNITAGTITTVGTVSALANNSVTAAALATDAVTEIQTGTYTFQKNTAGQKFSIVFYDSTTGNPKTSAAAGACVISKDFGAFASTNGWVTEVGHGFYYVTATQAETNASTIFLYCTATGAKDFNALMTPQH